jgi:hypothetical protein
MDRAIDLYSKIKREHSLKTLGEQPSKEQENQRQSSLYPE